MAVLSHPSKHVAVHRKHTGIGSDLVSVVGALAYAERTDRDLVIDWRNSRYLSDPAINLFPDVFTIPGQIGQTRIYLATPEFEDSQCPTPLEAIGKASPFEDFHAEMLAEPRAVAKSVIITRPMHHLPDLGDQRRWFREIQPAPRIFQAIENFYAKQMSGHTVVGIHIRHGNGETLGTNRDELIAQSLDNLADLCAAQLARMGWPADTRILVCTDSQELREKLAARLGNVIHYHSRIGTANSGPIHTADFGLAGAEEAIVEMWLLARCQGLVYTPSWFSHYARIVGDFRMEPANLDTVSLYGTAELYKARVKHTAASGATAIHAS